MRWCFAWLFFLFLSRARVSTNHPLLLCVRSKVSVSFYPQENQKRHTHSFTRVSVLTALQFLRSFARARTRATDFEESLVMRSFQPRGVFAASSSPSSWCCSSSLASSRETRERFHSKKRFFYPAAGVKSGRFFPASEMPSSSSSSSPPPPPPPPRKDVIFHF